MSEGPEPSPAPQTCDATWQLVESSGAPVQEFRQPVPGGWLVLVLPKAGGASCLSFLPDPEGAWSPPIKTNRSKRGFY